MAFVKEGSLSDLKSKPPEKRLEDIVKWNLFLNIGIFLNAKVIQTHGGLRGDG